MVQRTERLTLEIAGGEETDAMELARLAQQLRHRLLELDVEAVELVRTKDVPVGAKPGDALTIGSLVLTLAPTAVQGVVALTQRWFTNRHIHSIKITMGDDSLELTGASQAQLDELTQAFLDRHTKQ